MYEANDEMSLQKKSHSNAMSSNSSIFVTNFRVSTFISKKRARAKTKSNTISNHQKPTPSSDSFLYNNQSYVMAADGGQNN
jgi:hypothetical protein